MEPGREPGREPSNPVGNSVGNPAAILNQVASMMLTRSVMFTGQSEESLREESHGNYTEF